VNSQPLVYAIIPCFNQARYLPDAVNSLKQQTYTNWECIIVNDGSADDTRLVGQSLADSDSRVKYVEQANRGLAGARNRGLEEVRGDYIQFLDADDLLFPEKFETQLAKLRKTRELAVAYCRPFYCMGDKVTKEVHSTRPFPLLNTEEPLLDIALRWEKELVIPCHTFLFDACLFMETGIRFDEYLPNHEDFDCWMRILALKPVVLYIDRKLVIYRRHEASMVRDKDLMRSGFLQSLRKQRDLHRDNKELRWILGQRIRDLLGPEEKEPPGELPLRPLVSVILTSYNYEQYIAESIQSVLNQTYQNTELIIVDDGSTDRSREIIEQVIKDAKIKVQTVFKQQGGQATALNEGYKRVSGEIVCFLDSDDVWYEDRIETVVDFMRMFPGGGVYQHQMETGKGLKRNGLLSADVFNLWRAASRNGTFNIAEDRGGVILSPFVPTSGLTFRKAVLDKIFPLPAELATCPDGFITRTACVYGPLISIPATLGLWRDHDNNAGKRPEFSFSEFWKPVLMPALNRHYKKRNIPMQLIYEPQSASGRPVGIILGEVMLPFPARRPFSCLRSELPASAAPQLMASTDRVQGLHLVALRVLLRLWSRIPLRIRQSLKWFLVNGSKKVLPQRFYDYLGAQYWRLRCSL